MSPADRRRRAAGLAIRRAGPSDSEDLEDLAELERRCFERPWSQQVLAEEQALPSSCTLVACVEGVTAGYAIVRTIPGGAELLRLGVAPEHRRKSLARALMLACFEQLTRDAVPQLQLEVRADNLPALTLYGGLGFELRGRRRGYYEDDCDALLLTLEIPRRGP